jgi:hypothetical protein
VSGTNAESIELHDFPEAFRKGRNNTGNALLFGCAKPSKFSKWLMVSKIL